MKESINWFITTLKKSFDFTGRARRKEFWNFILIYLLVLMSLGIAESLTNVIKVEIGMGLHIGLLNGIYILLMLCPTLTVTTRRLHDTNRSGWWQLINLVPFAGFIVMLIFTSEDGCPGENQYGKNPRGRCMLIYY